VAVCWDAIDGSTVFELLDGSPIQPSMAVAARVLMVVWYCSVGIRMAIMFCTHLTPTAYFYSVFVCAPLQLAPQPTVDRTLQGLRLRFECLFSDFFKICFFNFVLFFYTFSFGYLER
jgi:hypothetical protein